jgi:DNA-binding XRE family transcriptional regulator
MAIAQSLVNSGATGANSRHVTAESLAEELQKRQIGRTSKFTTEKAAEVIEAIIDGLTWKQAAALVGVDRQTIWAWENVNQPFRDAIALAHKAKARSFTDDQLNIIAEVEIDPDNPKLAQAMLRKAEIMGRFRFDQAKCYDPALYGDKRQVETNITIETAEQRLVRLTQAANTVELLAEDYEVL